MSPLIGWSLSASSLVSTLLLLDPQQAPAQSPRTVTKLAEGVYAIQHRDAGDGFASGNTTVIIGERQVLVVDAGFLPSDARDDIAQVRQWTDKPVAFVVNTHFHNDHNFGNRAYLDAFPNVTIVAHVEAKLDMDRYGPGSASRVARGTAGYQRMLEQRKTSDGTALTDADRTQLTTLLAQRKPLLEELQSTVFQTATLTFDHQLSLDLGRRQVVIEFLGRGNTAGDAVVFLPVEKIVAAGDLLVHPLPYVYDGYPSEWVHTLDRLGQLGATTIVPGHGAVMRDTSYLHLVRDFFASAVEQMNTVLTNLGPAMSRTLDEVKGRIDLSPFRRRFAGKDEDLSAGFDQAAASLIAVVLREASLR